jgi:hypothetical protein
MALESNNFVENVVDGVNASGNIHELNVPVDLPFRTLWLFYSAAAFAIAAVCDLVLFNAQGNEILRLPAYRQPKNGVFVGCAVTSANVANLARTSGFQMFYNSSASASFFWLPPIPIKAACSRIVLTTDNPSSVTYSYLACLSASSDIIKTA